MLVRYFVSYPAAFSQIAECHPFTRVPNMLSLSPNGIAFICVVTVFAYSLRGVTGFGAVAAMPLMGLVVPMKVLVPVWTVLSFCGSATILRRDRGNIAWADLLRLFPTCMLGIGIGLIFFTQLDSRTLAQGLGVMAVLYGGFSLRASIQPAGAAASPEGAPAEGASVPPDGARAQAAAGPTTSRLLSPWGDARLAGLLGGAVGTTFGALSSLFFAMHFDAIGMPKDYFRATMSLAIVVIAFVRGLGYLAIGGFTRDVLLLLAITLPMTFAGIFIGERVQTGFSELTFRRLVNVTLILSGFALLVSQ